MTMVHNTEYVCIKDEQLQSHSRKIERLEARSESREATINEIKRDMEKMDKKLDVLLEGFNDFKMESNKDDTKLELRLKTIETELAMQKQANIKANQDNKDAMNTKIAQIGLVLTIITILLNVIMKFL